MPCGTGRCFNRAMPPAPAPDPERPGSYLVCATSRTGRSSLCGLPDSAGVAGHPESWFRCQDEREFAAEGTQLYPVPYEELAADPIRAGAGVLRFPGLDLPANREITVRRKRLADELSARWIESYRRYEGRGPSA